MGYTIASPIMDITPPPGLETPPGFENVVPCGAPVSQSVAFNLAPMFHYVDPLAELGPVDVMGNSSQMLFTDQNLELIRQNAELKEQLLLLSQTVALTQANVRRVEALRTSRAAWRSSLGKTRVAAVKSRVSFDCHVSVGPKSVPDCSLTKAKQVQFFKQSRDTSPAASTTASTCGFMSEADESNDSNTTVDQDEFRQTTVVMQSIPGEYARADLLRLIDQQGFSGLYDLVYLPVDFRSELNHGYAFINFTTAENAERFRDHFMGFSDWLVLSERICEVSWSDQSQGTDENVL